MVRLTRQDVLVPMQFLAIGGVVFWPGDPLWRVAGPAGLLGLTTALAGALLGLAGLAALGRDLTPFVTPRAGARLRTTGPYAVSRNPVYAGLAIAMTGLAVLSGRPESLACAVLLAVVLHLKTGSEERRLEQRFGAEYRAYRSRVPRLVGLPRRGSPPRRVRSR